MSNLGPKSKEFLGKEENLKGDGETRGVIMGMATEQMLMKIILERFKKNIMGGVCNAVLPFVFLENS